MSADELSDLEPHHVSEDQPHGLVDHLEDQTGRQGRHAVTGAAAPFDAIKQVGPAGERWSVRDLMPLLGYASWDRVHEVIERAMVAVNNAGYPTLDHIRASSVLTQTGLSGVERRLADYSLTRFGAYMVAMNGDPRKPEVAAAQSYFAIKTREAEAGLQLDIANRDHLSLILTAGKAALIRAIEAEAKVAELEPAAEAWSALAEASGDYSLREAGEVLSRDPRIDTGQNKLMRYLREIGWADRKGMVYQAQINTGRLAVRTRTYDDPYTGDPKLTTQIRVTAKSVDALRKMMTDPPVGLRALPGGAA